MRERLCKAMRPRSYPKEIPDAYKSGPLWTEKANTQTHRQKRTLIMQLKATYVYFTVLLSVLLVHSVHARPVDAAQRDLAERGGWAPKLSGQYNSKRCSRVWLTPRTKERSKIS